LEFELQTDEDKQQQLKDEYEQFKAFQEATKKEN
jgi:hypothetical protein